MEASILDRRTAALKQVLPDSNTPAVKSFTELLKENRGDLEKALSAWEKDSSISMPAESKDLLQNKLKLATQLATISDDNVQFIQAAQKSKPNVNSLRQFAINTSLKDLQSMTTSSPSNKVSSSNTSTTTATSSTSISQAAIQIRQKMFLAEPTGVIIRMLGDNEVSLDPDIHAYVYKILEDSPDFDIRKTPVSSLTSKSPMLDDMSRSGAIRSSIVSGLKELQRVQALSPIPEAINPLIQNKLTSALHISNLSEVAFVGIVKNQIGNQETAVSIHQHAMKSRVRNENFLISSLQAVQGTGLRVIDGGKSKKNVELRKASFTATSDQFVTQVNLEQLFGSIDFCDCSECGSVYGAASYFVELMEFLRNNNLSIKNSKTGAKNINGTQLQALLKRRPDLACLQLTCENTNTLIPYIDLALEVMESYVVHAPMITAYNVTGETSSELLCSPQHTNLDAYKILRKAIYPLGLPYHFPIDTMRVFLKFLQTSRADIIRVFQPNGVIDQSNPATGISVPVLRSFDAEFNQLTQEEYVILTKEAFVPETKTGKCHPHPDYAKLSGLRSPWEYFGYDSKNAMQDTNTGLQWVKAQFLQRVGIQYTDLVNLLMTRYVNPNMPTGKALATMERIKFSYRFLQYLVLHQYQDKRRRFAQLIQFLDIADELLPKLEAGTDSDGVDLCADPDSLDCTCEHVNPPPHKQCCCHRDEWTKWVYDWFERIGCLIVLESGEQPRIPLQGRVWADTYDRRRSSEAVHMDGSIVPLSMKPKPTESSQAVFLGTLKDDGALLNDTQNLVGFVSAQSTFLDLKGKNLDEAYPDLQLVVYSDDSDVGDPDNAIGFVNRDHILEYRQGDDELRRVQYSSVRDDCDITKTQLRHLDGSQLSPDEYFSMMRFVRLWEKLGWSISEVDEAINGLGKPFIATDGDTNMENEQSSDSETDDSADVDAQVSKPDITPSLIHQLVAVKKLLDITGLPLEVVLTFWDVLPTHSDTSLYATTFLTHNIVRMDPVFKPDANGNFFSSLEKISEHIPVLQAALRLKSSDIDTIRSLRSIPDALNMKTLSELFRFATLLRYLNIRSDVLADLLKVMGEPFFSADVTLLFVETWTQITNSNFTFAELDYLICGTDNLSHPLGPTPQTILKLEKTLLDGFAAIASGNSDISQKDVDDKTVNLPDLISAKLSLVFDPSLSAKINDLINGRMVFTTNAPSGLGIVVPAAMTTLAVKVKYNDQSTAKPPAAQLVVTGILTDEEATDLKGLSANTLWSSAVDRIKKQGVTFYNQYLASILPADGARTMLAGDTPDSVEKKGFYFMTYFMPYLRARLASAMVQQTMSDTLGADSPTTAYLLQIVKNSAGLTALDALLALKDSSQATKDSPWSGYLIPQTADKYQFWFTSDTKPPDFVLDGIPHGFPNQSEDPSNIWSSDPVPLVAGRLYNLDLTGITPDELSWSTVTSPPTTIPSACFLPKVGSTSVSEILTNLTKISLLIEGFNLSLDEITYFHDHGDDFSSLADMKALSLSNLSIGCWRRLISYANLRDALPKQQTRLIDLFAWSRLPNSTDTVGEIVKVTTWDANTVSAVLTGYGATSPDHFHNELTLINIKEALSVVNATAISVPLLFEWAKPLSLSDSSYKKLSAQADQLKNALRARYNASDWEQAAKPLFDTLRKNQRDALVAYLIVEPSLVATGLVKDADGLFEYFLIDCQMSSCLQTSRIKQAISTIQLYVQRCLLGLELEVGQSSDDLIDRKRWNWMKRYRVWEANREVYLYPENWIDPSLRDDKTPFYLDLESSLQQKDISLTSATASLKSYILNVAAVANLKVFGLFVRKDSTATNASTSSTPSGAHIVARRMNAPYDWYSRDYSIDGTWSPWVKMQVDIPNYDVDDAAGNAIASGALVAPYVWRGRPVIFFLQMSLKQVTDDNASAMSERMNQDAKAQNQTIPVWQINLGASRFDNGKWTPKELSESSLRHVADEVNITDFGVTVKVYPVPSQAKYQVVPRLISGTNGSPDYIQIDVVYTADVIVNYWTRQTDSTGKISIQNVSTPDNKINKKIGSFFFVDGGISQQTAGGSAPSVTFNQDTTFQYDSSNKIYSYQIDDGTTSTPQYWGATPSVEYPVDATSGSKSTFVATTSPSVKFVFNHTFVDNLLKQVNNSDDISLLYDDFTTLSISADQAGDNPFGTVFDSQNMKSYNEQMSPYGIYNWEVGLHAPMALINSLLNAQQFDDALTVCHTIFDPSVVGIASSTSGDNSQYWKFGPFKALANTDAKQSLETMFLSMSPGTADPDISAWRDNPFAPHVVARMRPVAYMKWIAMKYIEILIAYGDYYFRQNSLETIPDAIQCYILASHVYGPRGQKIPPRGKKKPQTYSSLLNRWDAFGNAIVQLEVEFPFSNQTAQLKGSSNGITGFANIFGFASSLYFCIPSNPKLAELRDTIDDRLYKIRNCMDINGVFRQLPLFDPPIDPGLLVAATAQGLSIDTVLNDLSGPVPNYRFLTLISKAIEICSELKSLGSSLLSTKEKKDNEHIATMRAAHETVVSNFSLDMKNRALDEANAVLTQLQQNRLSPSYRLQFYKGLVGLTDGAPGETVDFNEIPNPSLQAPLSNGQMLLIPEENEEVNKANAARDWNIGIGAVETLAGILHMWPDSNADVKPFGVGIGLKWGGTFLGGSTGAVARGLQIYATTLSADSSNAGRKAGLLRALQDRIFQANLAGHELKNVDAQIAAQRLRVATATQDIKNAQTSLDQATEVEQFLRTKYTNEELYTWMEGRTRALYNDTYNLAYDLAKRAEKTFQFERPQMATSSYIEMGYFSSARDGLLAGEALYLGLKKLEAAWQSDLGHDFEMTKHISVRQWAPLALLEFREKGTFTLDVPEILFDMDCPGHYMRRIVSAAVSIPCVAGPYSGINCTLRLLSNSMRTKARASNPNDYLKMPAD